MLELWISVYPNLIASLIWATPAFITSHLLHKRALGRQTEQLKAHVDKRLDQQQQ